MLSSLSLSSLLYPLFLPVSLFSRVSVFSCISLPLLPFFNLFTVHLPSPPTPKLVPRTQFTYKFRASRGQLPFIHLPTARGLNWCLSFITTYSSRIPKSPYPLPFTPAILTTATHHTRDISLSPFLVQYFHTHPHT
ncbi:hypothetical protein ABKN59_008610 [Abortiporus biennis]